jgi:ribosome modulation factor
MPEDDARQKRDTLDFFFSRGKNSVIYSPTQELKPFILIQWQTRKKLVF